MTELITFQSYHAQNALPPVKLDGYIYSVMEGSYQKTHNEQIVDEKYTPSGEMSRQRLTTNKHRWAMTFLVPINDSQIQVEGGGAPTTQPWGTLSTIHNTIGLPVTYDMVYYYDVTTNWDFSGAPTHYVYATGDQEVPHNNNISMWEVVISLWGKDFI
jgi:hypothetical protein